MPLLCWTNTEDIGAFTAQTQVGFQSLWLGGPGRELLEGKRGMQPPGLGRFALGTELGICEFPTPSTSERCSPNPFCTSSPRQWRFCLPPPRAGTSDDHLPASVQPWSGGDRGLTERVQMVKDDLRGSGSSLWVMLRIEPWGDSEGKNLPLHLQVLHAFRH